MAEVVTAFGKGVGYRNLPNRWSHTYECKLTMGGDCAAFAKGNKNRVKNSVRRRASAESTSGGSALGTCLGGATSSHLFFSLFLLSLPALRSHDDVDLGWTSVSFPADLQTLDRAQQCAELAADDAERRALTALLQEFPSAHPAELRRFLRKVGGDLAVARANYALHAQWRQDFPPDRDGTSVAAVPHWMWFEEFEEGSVEAVASGGQNGRMLWVQGAMFDSTAASVEDYVLATSRVLDSALDRASSQLINVYVDTAPYKFMRNEPATRVVRLAAKLASHLNHHYPGRLMKLVIFPVPSWGVYVWQSIKPLLPSRTAAKVDLRSTAPAEALAVQHRHGNAPL
jgi:hypothetical protein